MGKEFNWIGVVLLVLGSVLTLAGLPDLRAIVRLVKDSKPARSHQQ